MLWSNSLHVMPKAKSASRGVDRRVRGGKREQGLKQGCRREDALRCRRRSNFLAATISVHDESFCVFWRCEPQPSTLLFAVATAAACSQPAARISQACRLVATIEAALAAHAVLCLRGGFPHRRRTRATRVTLLLEHCAVPIMQPDPSRPYVLSSLRISRRIRAPPQAIQAMRSLLPCSSVPCLTTPLPILALSSLLLVQRDPEPFKVTFQSRAPAAFVTIRSCSPCRARKPWKVACFL